MIVYKISHLLPSLDNHLPKVVNITDAENGGEPLIFDVRDKLNRSKSELDPIYELDSKGFNYVSKNITPRHRLKDLLTKQYNSQMVTNAFTKSWEIVRQFNLIKPNTPFTYFDNANLPGAFVSAINQIAAEQNAPMTWYASSYMPKDAEKTDAESLSHLGDTYNLYKHNKTNYLNSDTNDGNLYIKSTIEDFKNKIPKTIDLYTSDYGTDQTAETFNTQEEVTLRGNFGQVLSALVTLKKGGTMFTKQFTFFLPFNVSLLQFLSRLFENVYIVKPLTSNPSNSEVYILAQNFLDNLTDEDIAQLMNLLEKEDIEKYVISPLNKEFADATLNIMEKIAESTIKHIRMVIEYYINYKSKDKRKQYYSDVEQLNNEQIKIWSKNYLPTQRLSKEYMLKIDKPSY